MNWNPTIPKTSISILLGLIFFTWQNSLIMCDKGPCYEIPLIMSIALIIIIYLLWSVFQKHNTPNS
jgi:hypothetical protein